MEEELLYWLWLSLCHGVTKPNRLKLIRSFGTARRVYEADLGALREEVPSLSQKELELLGEKDLEPGKVLLDQCRQKRITVTHFGSKDYPPRLMDIADAPMVLYYRGKIPDLYKAPSIGIVGARNATTHGRELAAQFGRHLASSGVIVISGMAMGIDAVAMKAALSVGTPVIGVLGCGVNRVYPSENRKLYEKAMECGCIISEYLPDSPPARTHFPARNRILSGLSNGILVVEAAEKSGSLITADFARRQGRLLFSVPGNAGEAGCAGTNQLLRSGAIFAENAMDILWELQERYPQVYQKGLSVTPHSPAVDPAPPVREPPKKARERTEKTIDIPVNPDYIDFNTLLQTADPIERDIFAALQDAPLETDELMARVGYPNARVLSALTLLQMNRRIVPEGNGYRLSPDILIKK